MKAIVLAAGAGARMMPLTRERHKSLLEVAGAPVLSRIVEGLRGLEVSEIVVVTGHLREQVEAFLRERHPRAPVTLVHNPRFAETNNIVSLALGLEAMTLDDDVALIECDVLFDAAILEPLRSPTPGNIALVDAYRPGMDGTVVSVAGGYVAQVFPPHLQGEDFDYRGKYKTVNIYRFEREFCRTVFRPMLSHYAQHVDGGCYYELVLGMLISMQRHRVRAVVVDRGGWAEVDDPNDLASARFQFEPGRRAEILESSLGGHWNFEVLDFSFMRNQYFPTDAMLAAMRRALPDLVRNYGSRQTVLDQKLAYILECEPAQLLCLNGGSQIFPWLPELFAGRRVLLPEPTFNEYPRWFPAHETYQGSLPERVRAGEVAMIVNPNNPTGACAAAADILALARAHPDADFLVDESFVAFSGQPSLVAAELPGNVLVMASLSKCWGVPGLRLGYAYSRNPAWMTALRARVPIWNLNALAEFFLELTLKFKRELAESLRRCAADREELARDLGGLPGIAEVYPSGGDFLLVRLEWAAAQAVVEQLLERHAIYVKNVSAKFRDGREYLRIAVRTPADHARLLAGLREALGEARRKETPS